MIVTCEQVEQGLKWVKKDGTVIQYPANVNTFVYNENNILILYKEDSISYVAALDDNGNVCAKMHNTTNIYIMYLQKHPRFDLCVVTSLKNKDGDWKDYYLAYHGSTFENVSIAR